MGEYADLMLEGHICQHCTAPMQEASGYPQSCIDCRSFDRDLAPAEPKANSKTKAACPICGKKVKLIGLDQHRRAAHPNAP